MYKFFILKKDKKAINVSIEPTEYLHLAHEILLNIMTSLTLKQLHVVASVSKAFYLAAKEEADNKKGDIFLNKIKNEITSTPPDFKGKKAFQYKRYYQNTLKHLKAIPKLETMLKNADFRYLLEINIFNYDVYFKKWLKQESQSYKIYEIHLGWWLIVDTIFNDKQDLFDLHIKYLATALGEDLKTVLNKNFYAHTNHYTFPESTLLNIATQSGKIYYIKVLLELGSDITVRNENNETAFFLAWKRNDAVFDLFIDAINEKDLKNLSSDSFYEKYGVQADVVRNSITIKKRDDLQDTVQLLNQQKVLIKQLKKTIEDQKNTILYLQEKLEKYESNEQTISRLK